MTDRATLLALAERVERLDGPDRLISLQIMCALDLRPHWLEKSAGHLWVDDSGNHPVVRWVDARMAASSGNPSVDDGPDFTASLDAAMTLVPAAGKWSVTAGHKGDWQACVWDSGSGSMEWRTSATPALALCAAALRARAEAGE